MNFLNRAGLHCAVNLAVVQELFGWIKAQVWYGRSRSREKGDLLKVPVLFWNTTTSGRRNAGKMKPRRVASYVERKVVGSILVKGDITFLQPR